MYKINYKLVYNRKNRLQKNGTALIQIECYQNGKRFFISTGIYIIPKLWDAKNFKIKSDHPNSNKLNKQISDKIASLENAELDFLNKGKKFTLDHLREFNAGNIALNFTDFMKSEIEKNKVTEVTKKGHRRTLDVLTEFKKSVEFSDINLGFLSDFERFLYKKGFSVNTVYKYFKNIKSYVNLAINLELMDINQYPFRKMKIRQIDGKRDYLTPQELELIENLDLTGKGEAISKIRDMYLFSCYTGLRFSDVVQVCKENLQDIDGAIWLIKGMQKSQINGDAETQQIVRLPIYQLFNGKPLDILNKYTSDRKYYFDDYTNQFVNRTLKDIADDAKINKKLTFHTARHTQATYLLYKGVNITTVQKLLGHKKVATTQIYGKVMDMTVINDLQGKF